MDTTKKIEPLGFVEKTERGFEVIRFLDRYGVHCSLQASSLWDGENDKPGTGAVWLGCDDPDPRVMASKAPALGIQTSETTGWVPYPVPEDVLMNTRAHLSREQVAALIKHLQAWLDTDSFKEDK